MKILSGILLFIISTTAYSATCGYTLDTSSMNRTVKYCLINLLTQKRYFRDKHSPVILKARLYWNAPIKQMVFRIQPRDKNTHRYLRAAIHVEMFEPTGSFEEEGCYLAGEAVKHIQTCI